MITMGLEPGRISFFQIRTGTASADILGGLHSFLTF
jgi:hypothetical protein